MGTYIYINCEDFSVICPHCDAEQREVSINRIYNPIIACEECGEEFELELPKD
jgi:uncharacterized Zn finger protein